MHIEERELKPYAEPVLPNELRENCVYFSLNYSDDNLLIPTLEPLVFIGRNLGENDTERVYFQDLASYRQGMHYDSDVEESDARFYVGLEKEINHIFTYEHAIDELLRCSLRRRAEEGAS